MRELYRENVNVSILYQIQNTRLWIDITCLSRYH